MKYYVSYVLNRKNAKPHRFNHGFGNYNNKAYNTLDEIKKDIQSMYHGYNASCEMARKTRLYIIKDTKGNLIGYCDIVKENNKYVLYWN